jgi:hypothetical protein
VKISAPFATPVSREQAAEIAADALHFVAEGTAYDIDSVVTVEEVTGRPPVAYIASNESIVDCWIIYLKPKRIAGLCPSTIALVSKATGNIVYLGSAGDEG